MKRGATVLYLIISTLYGYSQTYYFPFDDVQQMPCPFDSSQSVLMSTGYTFFSTLNDEWDGPIDSSICYSVTQNGSSYFFNTTQVPEGRTVFAEVLVEDSMAINAHVAHNVRSLFGQVFSQFCDSAACRKAIVVTSIPDSAGTSTVHRVRYMDIENQVFWGDDYTCFASERFDTQHIVRVLFEYTPEDSINGYIWSSEIWPGDGNIIPPTFGYDPITWWGPDIVQQFDSLYPSPDAVSFSEFIPFNNPTDSQHLDIYVPMESVLLYEPFTGLRGGLVEGSDSTRHSVSIINEGVICLPLLEVVSEGNNAIVFDNGTVDLQEDNACFMFGRGGTFKLKSGTRLDYGKFGRGILALKTGANVIIEPGGELNIGCKVHIYEYSDRPNDQELVIDLVKGAKLTFSPSATLSNAYSYDQDMKLKVRMLGGELDDSGLSESEKAIIERIYEEPAADVANNLNIYPNPAGNNLEFTWVATSADVNLGIEVIDLSGKVVFSAKALTATKGHNAFRTDIHALDPGIYILRLNEGDELVTKRFVKL